MDRWNEMATESGGGFGRFRIFRNSKEGIYDGWTDGEC